MPYYLAIDIGASSGRHILGWLHQGLLVTEEVHRFENRTIPKNGALCWDVEHLFHEILTGLARCKALGKIPATVGIDTWGVDFMLVDSAGQLLGDAVSYRDDRTRGMDALVEELIPFSTLYNKTGIQKQQFNTIYQLVALQQTQPQLLAQADSLLMVPDYFHFLLTGIKKQEYTNATTTALVNATTKTWDTELLQALGLPAQLFGELSLPGTVVGSLTDAIASKVGFTCEVVLPPTHDTACAYLAVPTEQEDSVYLSSGTWSLLGTECDAPVLSAESEAANFSNEGGYDYRFRLLTNIMGLWIIQSIRRELTDSLSYAQLSALAEQNAGFPARFDANHPALLAPTSMTETVKQLCKEAGGAVPSTLGELMETVYQSLALCYANATKELEGLLGKRFSVFHIVGGGSQNNYLNQLTANATALPVLAGPTEGTVLGNLAAQLIARGELKNRAEARQTIKASQPITQYNPQKGE